MPFRSANALPWWRSAAALALTAGCLAGCVGRPPTLTLSLSREELQQAVSERFPVKREELLASVTFRDPQVILREGDNRVGIDLEARIKLPLVRAVQGRAAAVGEVAYDPATRAFFFRNPEITRLDLSGPAEEFREPLTQAVEQFAAPVLEETPVYTLKDRSTEEKTAGYLLRRVSVRDGKLHLTLGLPEDADAPGSPLFWAMLLLTATGLAFAAGFFLRGRKREDVRRET